MNQKIKNSLCKQNKFKLSPDGRKQHCCHGELCPQTTRRIKNFIILWIFWYFTILTENLEQWPVKPFQLYNWIFFRMRSWRKNKNFLLLRKERSNFEWNHWDYFFVEVMSRQRPNAKRRNDDFPFELFFIKCELLIDFRLEDVNLFVTHKQEFQFSIGPRRRKQDNSEGRIRVWMSRRNNFTSTF